METDWYLFQVQELGEKMDELFANNNTSASDKKVTLIQLTDALVMAKRENKSHLIDYFTDLLARYNDGELITEFDLKANVPLSERYSIFQENVIAGAEETEFQKQQDITLSAEWDEEWADKINSTNPKLQTDIGNAYRFIVRYGRNVRYCCSTDEWLMWNRQYLEVDKKDTVMNLAKSTALRIADEAKLIQDYNKQSKAFAFCGKSQSVGKLQAMIRIARSDVTIAVSPTEMDRNKNTLNFPNGTLDLPSMKFRDHQKDELCTRMMGAKFDEKARCPLWHKHLELIFDKNEEFIHNFQLMCGYSLLPENPEQLLFMLYGEGKNGKSVTLSVIQSAMGNYSNSIDPSTLMQHKFSSANSSRDDLVRLLNVRMTTCTEGDNANKFSESTLKRLTGDDKITARPLYGKPIDFLVTTKIWFATNHLPNISETKEAIWRRIWPIPFTVTIKEEDRDRNIRQKLEKELPGIIQWMLDGMREYYTTCHGSLPKPKIVLDAIDEYKRTSDTLLPFLELQDIDKNDKTKRISKKALYDMYEEYCDINGDDPVKKYHFGKLMSDRGFKDGRDESGSTRIWYGISAFGKGKNGDKEFVNKEYKK